MDTHLVQITDLVKDYAKILVVVTLIGISFLAWSVITVADYYHFIKTKNDWFKKKEA